MLQDARFAIRLLRKQPGFTAIAVLTLALSIGVSTALFSVIDAALLHPLPFPHPEQLAEAYVATPSSGGRLSKTYPSVSDARAWRSSAVITASAVVRDNPSKTMIDAGGGPERVIVNEISDGYLNVCGVRPILGRDIAERDVAVGVPSVVLLGYDYWLSRFNANPDVIGRSVRFSEKRSWAGPEGVATIVGVLPKGFYLRVSMWRSQSLEAPYALLDKRGTGASTIVRLRAGTSLDDAAHALTAVIRSQPGELPQTEVQLRSFIQETTSGYAPTVNVLASAVGLILVIGCVNVAGLLLTRGATRRPEFAIRASIGAGRGRLIRQLLTESVILAAIGGAVGVLLAWLALDGLVALVPLQLPTTSAVAVNGVVLTFALALSLVTAIAFGLVPAWKISRVSLHHRLSSGGRHGGALTGRGGQMLIAVEVALAVVLVSGAGLLLKSFARTTSVDLGIEPSMFMTLDATPISQEPAALTQYYRDLRDRLRGLPGVAEVSAVDDMPVGDRSNTSFFEVEGHRNRLSATRRNVMPGYLEAMGQRLVEGRVPPEAEVNISGPFFLINETAARAWFPDGHTIGRHITMFPKLVGAITGVVADVRQNGPLSRPGAELLVLSTQPMTRAMRMIIRPMPGARVPSDALRKAALDIGPTAFVEDVRSGTDWVALHVVTPRRRTLLFGLLGGLGLVLTLVGAFGITAYAVTRRTQEMAVRMAFGAEPRQVVRQIVIGSVGPALIGALAGLGAAYLSLRVIAKFLFQVSATDPATLAAACAVVALAVGIAAWLPARRTARVDPAKVLREVQ